MKRTLTISIVMLAVVTGFFSCGKSTLDCSYTVRPRIAYDALKQDSMVLVEAVGYAFFADTASWKVASFEDARDGVITSKLTGEKRDYDLADQTNTTGAITFQLQQRPVILLVCLEHEGLYAWRHAEVQNNLETVNVPVRFNPWRTATQYTDSRWTMVNEFYTAPPVVIPDR